MNALQHLFSAVGMRGGSAVPPDMARDSLRAQPQGLPVLVAQEGGARGDAQALIAQLQQENQRLQAEGQARSQWFASAIHDLRQPLQALMLFSEALDQAPAPAVPQHVARVRQSVASLDRLCAGLLDLACIEAGRSERRTGPVALAPVFDELRQTFGPVAQAQGLRLVVRPSCLSVRGDALMLTRMLNNLVGNALRYTQRGGVLVGARRQGGAVKLLVHDTGMGIAAEHQHQVFQPFFQVPMASDASESHGHGLGLSGVRHLAQLQGASVSLRSQCGRGTTVSVQLALACAATQAGTP